MEANDWVMKGKTMNYWQYPPQLPTQEEVEAFEDGLVETIPAKLLELYDRKEAVADLVQRKADKAHDLDKRSKIFATALLAEEYREVKIIEKWIKYWLFIQRMIEKRTDPLVEVDLTELDIAQAKAHPFEQIFSNPILKKNRKYQIGLCPFHLEKTPSFTIYLETNSGYCFGCHWSGDTISFRQDKDHLTFKNAVRSLI